MYSIFKTFGLILLIAVSCSLAANPMDSLRMEKIKGQHFIIHRIEQGETLYSLSRRYDCSVDDIKKFNPSTEDGLRIFDEIKIPSSGKKRKKGKSAKKDTDLTGKKYHIVGSGETLYAISRKHGLSVDSLKTLNHLTSNEISIKDTLWLSTRIEDVSNKEVEESTDEQDAIDIDSDSVVYHIVQPKETMLSLTRLHKVNLDSLMKWNAMENYNLSIGQKIIVRNTVQVKNNQEVTQNQDIEETKPEKAVPDTIYVKTDESKFRTKINETDGHKYVNQEGFAMRIDDTSFTTKYLALHRSAPIGTVVSITNQMNKRTVDVRVVGKLPDTGLNENVLIRISEAAYKELGAIDLKVPVNSVYEQK